MVADGSLVAAQLFWRTLLLRTSPTHSVAEVYEPSASALTAVTDNIVPVLGRLA